MREWTRGFKPSVANEASPSPSRSRGELSVAPASPIPRYNLPMSRTAAEILEDARQLPPGDLDWLVQNLVHEGDGTPEAEIEAAWEVEIKRRLDEIDSGAVDLIPGEQVRAEMIASLSPQARARLRI